MDKVRSNSRVAEVEQVMKNIIAASEKSDWSADVYLTTIVSEVKLLFSRMSSAVNRDKVESLQAELDLVRDASLKKLVLGAKGYRINPLERINRAAEVVCAVIDKYGLDIADESYDLETSHLNALLRDLAEEKVVEAIGELPGMEELIAQVAADQNSFETEYQNYLAAKASEGEQESATEIKKEALELLNGKFYFYLNAMFYVNEPVYGLFVREVSEIINRNNSAVKKRLAE